MAELEKCAEWGKVLKDDFHAPYCKACDDKLDKQFDTIEDNVLIFKELLDSEIETLKKLRSSLRGSIKSSKMMEILIMKA